MITFYKQLVPQYTNYHRVYLVSFDFQINQHLFS
jgi:hypothetical protein